MADPLAGLAPNDAVPRFRSAEPLAALGLGPEEGFVLSRVDGVTRLGELIHLVPFPHEQTVAILKRLWIAGAIEIVGHAPPVMVDKATAPEPPRAASTAHRSSTAVPAAASLPPDVQLTPDQARTIDDKLADIQTKNAFELLGLPRGCDKKEVKRAYFKLSKEFHPDRFYGKNLGPYRERLATIFQAVKAAFDLLSDDARRQAYEDSLGSD
jgi:hypothetical protein